MVYRQRGWYLSVFAVTASVVLWFERSAYDPEVPGGDNFSHKSLCETALSLVRALQAESPDCPKYADQTPQEPIDLTERMIGKFGPWQFKICLLMILLKLPNSWYQLNIVFMAPSQEFWCAKPENMKCTIAEWRKMCSPMLLENPCLIYDPDVLAIFPDIEKKIIRLVACPKFVYNNTYFKRTIVSDWDLVCTKHWLVHLTQCVIMFGILVGSLIFGTIADRHGRRLALIISIILQAVFSFILSFVPNYADFLFTWFIVALANGGLAVIPFVLSIEVVSGSYRTIVPILNQIPFGVGTAILSALAYWLRDWRKLEFVLGILSTLYISYWFTIEESPRWLLAKGRTEEALAILNKAAKTNNRQMDPREIEALLTKYNRSSRQKPHGFFAFLKSSSMRYKTVLLSISWFFTGLSFYTFSQYLGYMASNIFLAVAVTGVISAFGGIACIFIVKRYKRKTTIAIFQVVYGVCFALILLTSNSMDSGEWVRLLFAGIGFAGMSGSIPALYLYTGELFPTLSRNVGISGVTMFARIASMAAPAVVYLDTVITDLPLMLLTMMAFAQILLIAPLPETRGRPLPDTLEQAEAF